MKAKHRYRLALLWQTLVLTLVALGLLCLCSCSGQLAMQKEIKGEKKFYSNRTTQLLILKNHKNLK